MQQKLHFSYHDFNHLFIFIAYPPSFVGDGLSPPLHSAAQIYGELVSA